MLFDVKNKIIITPSYNLFVFWADISWWLCFNSSNKQMIFLKQTLCGTEKLYLPLETGNVSQFAFAAFSGVAAGHKVNRSWGRCV